MSIKNLLYLFLLTCISTICGAQNSSKSTHLIPLKLDERALSGLDLKRVINDKEPDRVLHQKRLMRGKDLSVYVVSSETKTASWDDYGIEEFIFVINGRARLNPIGSEEVYFSPGDFFIAPLGYKGEWETQASGEHYYEISVIATKRKEKKGDHAILPVSISDELLSGIHIPNNVPEEGFVENVHTGAQLDVKLIAENSIRNQIIQIDEDELIYIIAGSVKLKDKEGIEQTFFRGDFFMLPAGYKGFKTTEGHSLFRYVRVTSTFGNN